VKLLSPRRQIVPRDDFFPEIHFVYFACGFSEFNDFHTRKFSVTPHA
jgi:hypothetical protein